MKSITIRESYNIDSNGMIKILTSQKYYDYLTSVTPDMISSKITFLKEDNNFIYMKLSNNLILDLPNFFRVSKSFNNSKVIESYKIDKRKKIVTININSEILNKGSCKCNCLFTLKDIAENKILTAFTLSCECKLPIIGSRVEDEICSKAFEKNKLKIKSINKYINRLSKM